MTNQQPTYYAIIPAPIRYDKSLPAGAKLMYGEITALSNQSGYCFATNGYFADLYGCTKQAISNWIKLLEKAGYVKTSYSGTKGNTQRKVSIAIDGYQSPLRGVSMGVEGVSTQVEGVSMGVDHNNTSNNIAATREENENEENQEPQLQHASGFANGPYEKTKPLGISAKIQSEIKAKKFSEESIPNRREIMEIIFAHIETEEFKEEWKFITLGLGVINPKPVMREYAINAHWSNLTDFKLNKLRKWAETYLKKITNNQQPTNHGGYKTVKSGSELAERVAAQAAEQGFTVFTY